MDIGGIAMEIEVLKSLINEVKNHKFESETIEIKSSKEGNTKRFYDTVSAFSNTSGGIILFGIDEKENFNVCGVKDVKGQQTIIQDVCKNMEPIVRPNIIPYEYSKGVIVIAVEIPEMEYNDKPCYYRPLGINKGSFIRTGDSDTLMTEMEIQQFIDYQRKNQIELETFPGTISDKKINHIKLNSYLEKEVENKPNLSSLEPVMVEEMLGLKKDNNPTLCSLLAFGLYPQEIAPMMTINCTKVRGNNYIADSNINSRFISNYSFSGSISEMFNQTMTFIKNNIQINTVIDEQGNRKDDYEYPIIAIRECIINALIHRDYSHISRNIPISVTIFNNRIEVVNPGALIGNYKIEDLGKKYLPVRNPFLAHIMEVSLETENRHTGISVMNKSLKLNNQVPPLFESSRGYFSVTIYKEKISNKKLKDIAEELLFYCNKPRSKDSIAERFGYSNERSTYFFNTYVQPLINKELLFFTIPYKPNSKYQKITNKRPEMIDIVGD